MHVKAAPYCENAHGSSCGSASRRTLLTGAGSLSLAALLGTIPGLSMAKAAGPGRGCIDVHHHYLPPQYLKEGPPAVKIGAVSGWNPARAVEDMDRAGIALSMLSFSSPYLWFPGIEPGRSLSRLCNDYSAQMMRDHPGRFGLFAGIPSLDDTDGCLREIEYAFGTLKAHGVTVMTSYADKWLGDPSFAPVWDELNRRGAVVFVHPSIPGCCGNTVPGVSPAYAELPFDTARAIISLWYNGALDRWPKIRFIFSHGGGALPMIADRIDKLGRPGTVAGTKAHDANISFRKLYFDTANAANPPALAALRAFTEPGHILFGSDYPYVSLERGLKDLGLARLTLSQRQAIERNNALKLIPTLG